MKDANSQRNALIWQLKYHKPILEQQQMSVVEMQEKLKLAKEAIKIKLEKLKNRKKSKPSIKNRKTNKNMAPEEIVGKTVDHIFAVDVRMAL